MRHETDRRTAVGALGALPATVLFLFLFLFFLLLTPSAQASPFHPRREALDVTGLNHACGAATDSQGDLYLSSAGTSEIKVYDPEHNLLTQIEDT
ncbi:MAG: hypothetical protein ACM3N0_12760, partial [Chloroflexota bacterium]